MNKKGTLAFSWIYGVVFLLSVGLLFIVFNQILVNNFMPVINNLLPINGSANNQIVVQNNEWLSLWNSFPYLIVFIIIIYWLIEGIKKGKK